MESPLIAIGLVIGLFLMGVVSPGPNFLVVAERSMSGGFRAGVVTGLGVATGDAIYAAAGLLGFAALVAQAGWILTVLKVLGGLYLISLGLRTAMRRREPALRSTGGRLSLSDTGCFRAGLLTDLSNPKTVVFFASIFATAYDTALPASATVAMWTGIVTASLAWRTGLALVFSRHGVQVLYKRLRRGVEIVFGAVLFAFGLRLVAGAHAR